MKIPYVMRFECPNSYAVEEDCFLHCDVGNYVCDGTVYECCMWDKSFAEQLTIMQGLMKQEGCDKE